MRALLVSALAIGCGGGGGDGPDAAPLRACQVTTTTACTEAANHADLAWLVPNVFVSSCTFSGCHNGSATAAGALDLRTPEAAHATLVNVPSHLDPGAMLVVPGQPKQSYLLMMMQQYAPADMDPPLVAPPATVGYMPQNANGAALCCQKLDAVERWIAAGAPAS